MFYGRALLHFRVLSQRPCYGDEIVEPERPLFGHVLCFSYSVLVGFALGISCRMSGQSLALQPPGGSIQDVLGKWWGNTRCSGNAGGAVRSARGTTKCRRSAGGNKAKFQGKCQGDAKCQGCVRERREAAPQSKHTMCWDDIASALISPQPRGNYSASFHTGASTALCFVSRRHLAGNCRCNPNYIAVTAFCSPPALDALLTYWLTAQLHAFVQASGLRFVFKVAPCVGRSFDMLPCLNTSWAKAIQKETMP